MTIRRILSPLLAAGMAVSLCGCLQTLDQISDTLDTLAGPSRSTQYYYPQRDYYPQRGNVVVTSGYGLPVQGGENVYNMTGRQFLQGGNYGYASTPRCPPPGTWGAPRECWNRPYPRSWP